MDTQIELAKIDFDIYTIIFRGLKEAWESGRMTGNEFKLQGKEIWRKRVRLNKERTALQQDRNNILERMDIKNPRMLEAYRTAITPIFWSNSAPPVSERRNKHTHNQWKQHLHRWYNADEPLKEGQKSEDRQVWCPILKGSFNARTRCAAHIVPHFLGYENIAWMFGAEGDMAEGSSLVWDFRNGMVMAKILETRFDEGDFVIVPIPTPKDEPQSLRFVLLNRAYSHHPVLEGGPQPYSDLDGSELVFRGTARPGLRFLY